jgi:DNA-binding NarL/FixJ family response regulator
MTGPRRTIMLVDDHAVVREGFSAVLQKQPGLRVVAEAADGAEAYRLFKEVRPDLVIMDLAMPGIGGIEAVRRIRQWDRGAKILVFTMHQNAAFCRAGDPRRRAGLCHQDQSAGDAGSGGHGCARGPDRHQPGYRS